MQRFIAVLLCCVCVVLATPYSKFDLPIGVQYPWGSVEEKDNPTPCCLPKQWQGNMTGQFGNAGRYGAKYKGHNVMLYVDETNKRIAGRTMVGCRRNETGGFIMRHNSDNSSDFFAFNMNRQKCFKKHLDHARFHEQCIPQNATYEGQFSVGPSSGGLTVQGWSFHGGKRGERGAMCIAGRILVIPSGCVPVLVQDHGMFRVGPPPHGSSSSSEEVWDEDEEEVNEISFEDDFPGPHPGPRPGPHHRGRGGAFIASAYFSNVQTSIQDPTVFTPPSYCNATYESVVEPMKVFCEDEPFTDVISRFADVY